MPSTYSNLKIQLMATGENNTTWGNVTNINLGTAIEEAIAGSADVTFASGDVTLTLSDTNASQTARNMRLRCTGTTGGARNLIVPSIEKAYIVQNDCADAITVKTAAGTGIAVPAGKTMWVYNNGTNVVDAVTHLSSLTLDSALPVTSGGTGNNTALTTGSIVFIGASGTYSQDNANLFWDDTNNRLGIGTSAPSFELDVKGAGTTTSARIVGGGITTAPASGGTLTIHTLTNGVARTGLDVSFTDGAGSRLGGFKFSDTQTSGDWISCQLEMVQSYGAANELVSKLQVEDASWAGMRFVSQTNAGAALATSPTFIWRNYTTEQMRITAAGDVGIGTSTPTSKLDVSGTVTATAFSGSGASLTSLPAGNLTGTVAVTNGGTGSNTASGARTNLSAAKSGANTDITSLNPTGGLQVGSPTGGAQGTGTINATGLFVNGVAVGTSTGSVTSVNASGGTTGLTFSGGPITTSGTLTLAGTLAVTNGGTGSTTASGARTNLGLGSIATQSSSSVAITGGSITGITDLAVADGGTGASTAADARTNLGLGSLATLSSINNSNWSGTALAIANGGTGSTSAAAALLALGALGLTSVTFGTNTIALRVTLSNGDTLLIQGGTGSLAGNSTGTISFPSSYSIAPVCIVGGGASGTSAEGDVHLYSAASTTGVSIVNSAASTGTYTWYAIGKA